MPASSKDFPHIQATTECGLTLKRVRGMISRYSKFYHQIDGVVVDSPLAPILANIFMGFYEPKWRNELNLWKPKFYLRYADDIQAAFDNEQDSLIFLHFLNKKYPHIKFSIEKRLTIPSRFFMYSFQVSTIKISHFKYIANQPI